MRHIERVKTGVRAVGYVKLDESVAWPEFLEKNLIRPDDLVQVDAPPRQPGVPTLK
jgi:HlyD family secretion protein